MKSMLLATPLVSACRAPVSLSLHRHGLLLLFVSACYSPVPETCVQDLEAAAQVIQSRWPTAGEAWDHPYNEACVWYWSHGKRSINGMGVAMVTLEDRPGIRNLVEDIHDEFASGSLKQPSLLFFDQTEEHWRSWELIGFGYHADYEPCTTPQLGCINDEAWFVHEAGYHQILDGEMTLATDADLLPYSFANSVDAAGCEDIGHHDLAPKLGTVAHGRAWDLHVWLDPSGGRPWATPYDPWNRWNDAPVRLDIEEEAFFTPQTQMCECP